MNKQLLWKASEASRFNREALDQDSKCGCYFCLKVFSPSEIVEWSSEPIEGVNSCSAICPYCGVDAVLPESAGYPLTQEFLAEMHVVFFGKD